MSCSGRYHLLYRIYFKLSFLGGSEDHRKITWVDWNSVCLSKEVGGLGVRSLREFNYALLGKWCWRLLADRNSLWFRVMAARYGVEGSQLAEGGRSASSWWRIIATLRREEWFTYHVSYGVGNGKLTMFWSDVWVGGVALRERFSRLFDLSCFNEVSVFDMCQLGWGEGGEAWQWRRGLFAWEEEAVGELCLLLQNVNLQVDKEDRWHWNLEMSNAFSVRSAYKVLATHHTTAALVTLKSLRQKDIPLKVVLFAWRLFRDRLSTKDNLIRREL
jgi:hypothetical protein